MIALELFVFLSSSASAPSPSSNGTASATTPTPATKATPTKPRKKKNPTKTSHTNTDVYPNLSSIARTGVLPPSSETNSFRTPANPSSIALRCGVSLNSGPTPTAKASGVAAC